MAIASEPSQADACLAEHEKHTTRNLLALAAGQIVTRVGWIFKTESIIMPVVADALGGPAWVRGCLPLLNRIGHAVPPLLATRRVEVAGRKKWILGACIFAMATCFAILAWGWAYLPRHPLWTPLAFLTVYTFFFAATGIHQLAFNTLQGKLIPVNRRGRLLSIANVTGSVLAISFALWLMPQWLSEESAEFPKIFSFTATCFALAALTVVFVREPVQHSGTALRHSMQLFSAAWMALRTDRAFRRLVAVAMLFGASIVLFPHYQALARARPLSMDLTNLLTWVVIQNLGTGICSLIVGPIADRFGYRRVLLIGLLGIAMAPCLALLLAATPELGRPLFPIVFVLIGLTPVLYRCFLNFTLELAKPDDHPKYITTMGLCLSIPALASPLVGLLIDQLGFGPVFLGVASLVVFAWILAFTLKDPRSAV